MVTVPTRAADWLVAGRLGAGRLATRRLGTDWLGATGAAYRGGGRAAALDIDDGVSRPLTLIVVRSPFGWMRSRRMVPRMVPQQSAEVKALNVSCQDGG